MACALGFFTVGTSLASMAKSTALLLAARAIQGLGGGGILALTYVITAEMSSPHDRGRWLGVISSQWAIGSTIAPSVGGALAQYADWRWIFWLSLPFCVSAFILIPFLLRPHGGLLPGVRRDLLALDWLGAFALVCSIVGCLVPLTLGNISLASIDHYDTVPLMT